MPNIWPNLTTLIILQIVEKYRRNQQKKCSNFAIMIGTLYKIWQGNILLMLLPRNFYRFFSIYIYIYILGALIFFRVIRIVTVCSTVDSLAAFSRNYSSNKTLSVAHQHARNMRIFDPYRPTALRPNLKLLAKMCTYMIFWVNIPYLSKKKKLDEIAFRELAWNSNARFANSKIHLMQTQVRPKKL